MVRESGQSLGPWVAQALLGIPTSTACTPPLRCPVELAWPAGGRPPPPVPLVDVGPGCRRYCPRRRRRSTTFLETPTRSMSGAQDRRNAPSPPRLASRLVVVAPPPQGLCLVVWWSGGPPSSPAHAGIGRTGGTGPDSIRDRRELSGGWLCWLRALFVGEAPDSPAVSRPLSRYKPNLVQQRRRLRCRRCRSRPVFDPPSPRRRTPGRTVGLARQLDQTPPGRRRPLLFPPATHVVNETPCLVLAEQQLLKTVRPDRVRAVNLQKRVKYIGTVLHRPSSCRAAHSHRLDRMAVFPLVGNCLSPPRSSSLSPPPPPSTSLPGAVHITDGPRCPTADLFSALLGWPDARPPHTPPSSNKDSRHRNLTPPPPGVADVLPRLCPAR